MDSVPLVDSQIDDGQRLVDALGDAGITVLMAFWMKPVEEGRWSLYVVTPLVDERGLAYAFRQIFSVLRNLHAVWISDSDVKIAGSEELVAKDALKLLERYSAKLPVRLREQLVGRIAAEELFLYPRGKVEITVYGMTFPGEPNGALHLSLSPHNPNSWLEIGSLGRFQAETGINWLVAAPEGSQLERNKEGFVELKWKLHGKEKVSDANEVWTLANLAEYGFRFLRKPDQLDSGNAA